MSSQAPFDWEDWQVLLIRITCLASPILFFFFFSKPHPPARSFKGFLNSLDWGNSRKAPCSALPPCTPCSITGEIWHRELLLPKVIFTLGQCVCLLIAIPFPSLADWAGQPRSPPPGAWEQVFQCHGLVSSPTPSPPLQPSSLPGPLKHQCLLHKESRPTSTN